MVVVVSVLVQQLPLASYRDIRFYFEVLDLTNHIYSPALSSKLLKEIVTRS